jgi:hypothetical protein
MYKQHRGLLSDDMISDVIIILWMVTSSGITDLACPDLVQSLGPGLTWP